MSTPEERQRVAKAIRDAGDSAHVIMVSDDTGKSLTIPPEYLADLIDPTCHADETHMRGSNHIEYWCSNCKGYIGSRLLDTSPYCPHCGARVVSDR